MATPPHRESASVRQTYLVCYDICDDKRLRKVHKTMRNFGDHLQYSVFECQLTPIDLAKCQSQLNDIIQGGGVSINKIKIHSIDQKVDFELLQGKYLLVQKGKKNYYLLKVVS